MDATNKQSLYTYGRLEETEVNFGLNEEQQRRWDRLRSYNAFLRAEHHNVHTMLWKPGYLQTVYGAVEGQKGPHHHHHDLTSVHLFPDMDSNGGSGGSDSCRFSGTISVNKVAGNLHISAGKYLPLPIGHAHVSLLGGGGKFTVVVVVVIAISKLVNVLLLLSSSLQPSTTRTASSGSPSATTCSCCG